MWKFISSLLFFFVYMNYVSSIIVFPFKITENKEKTFDNRNDLHSPVYLGESKQLTDLFFNSEDHLYFIDHEKCKGSNFFIKNFSEYEKSSYTIELEDNEKAVQIKETIYLYEDLKMEKIQKLEGFPFLMKLSTIAKNKGCFLFGTLYRTNKELRQINFIEELKKLKLINGYAWTFKYTSDNEGLFILGDEPHVYDPDNYNGSNFVNTLPQINPHSYGWIINLDKIYSGEEQLPKPINCRFSFSNNYILADATYNKTISKQFFNNYISKHICYYKHSSYDQCYYYCDKNKFKQEDIDKFPKLTMTNVKLEKNFSFTGRELFYEGNDYYYFKLQFKSFSVGWVIGQLFIRKYQFVFNYDKKTIGYYNDDRMKPDDHKDDGSSIAPKKSDKLYLYIFIPLSVVVLGAIIFVLTKFYFCKICCNKDRKRKINELDDENEEDFFKINGDTNNQENNEDDKKLYKSNE